MAAGHAARLVHLLARTLNLLQDAAAVREQPLAALGQRHATAVALEQRLAQLDLERAHLAAERRLRDAEEGRGSREAAKLGDMDEVFQLPEIH